MVASISTMLDALAEVFAGYGYAGLFAISFVAAFALPIPSSIALAVSGALAAEGYLNVWYVLAVALCANVLADVIGFSLARAYGRIVFESVGLGFILRSRAYVWLDQYLAAFPQAIIYTTRLMTEAGPTVNVLAGLSRVRFRTFLTYGLLGEASYVLLFGLAGFFLGDAWRNNSGFLFKGLLVLILLGTIGGVAQYLLRTRIGSPAAPAR